MSSKLNEIRKTLKIPIKKKIRQDCHKEFDKLWKYGGMTRKQAYAWLARELGIEFEECHFSTLSLAELQKAKLIILKKRKEWKDRGKRSLTRRRRASLCGFGNTEDWASEFYEEQ
jgi:hypothetical protein